MSAHRLLRWVHHAIAWSLLTGVGCRFPFAQDRFDQLLAQLQGDRKSIAIISLNYDILVEEALMRVGGAERFDAVLHYPTIDRADRWCAGVPVFKLHGSANWFVDMSRNVVWGGEIEDRSPEPFGASGPHGGPESGHTHVADCRENATSEYKLRGNLLRDPILAVYAEEKHVPVNYNTVAAHRQACMDLIADNPDADARVIGVHIPETDLEDPPLRGVLRALASLKGRCSYVSPTDTDRQAAADLGLEPAEHLLEEVVEHGHL